MRVPAEKRGEPKDLPLYGFWQTEPYRVPVVTNVSRFDLFFINRVFMV